MFNPSTFEEKWKKKWEDDKIYHVTHLSDKPKYYVLDMFPYPSGAGLHVGHPLGYIASDIMSRYKRMQGFNVLHPMGYDAFGLPAEQYAIQTGVHPAKSTSDNIDQYRKQLKNIGFSYDWSREVKTCDASYFKWTQWIFMLLYKSYYDNSLEKAAPITDLISYFENNGSIECPAFGENKTDFTSAEWNAFSDLEKDTILMNYRLAYRKTSFVNWCEELGTVLANDEIKDGLSERGGYPVVRKPMTQWSLRITAYAERMLNSLDSLEWSDSLKAMQRNWIGKSVGATVFFPMEGSDEKLEVFTTRPDTLFGVTFMVIAPEHPILDEIVTADQKEEINKYKEYVKRRTERERIAETDKVSGAFTGSYTIHPFSGEKIPIWISEYVLMDYGTGAIMAVPGDDKRDEAFAQKFDLPIVQVIDRSDFPGTTIEDKVGKMVNSSFLNGMDVKDAIEHIIEELGDAGYATINYKLRDALYSRQRYWGEPFPIVYDENGVSQALPEEELPVELPIMENFKPDTDGQSPLARNQEWLNYAPGLKRETDTMPGYAGSSWYFLRFMDPGNDAAFASKEALNYWRDVDLYIGGTEHAVGHLMYSRFWHKFLYDLGHVPTNEPFKKLVNQGMIQGVIEYIYLQKEKENGVSKFLCAQLAESKNLDDFVKIPVLVDYVQDYGSEQSFLNRQSIEQFTKWRPEYKNAIFECGNGKFQKSKFTANDGGNGTHMYTHSEIGKMSKRYFNVINPDSVIDQYGADTFRMYEMFLGPLQQSKPWSTHGIDGVYKFLKRAWSLYFDRDGNKLIGDDPADENDLKILHQTIQKVRMYLDQLAFNTCVSSFMICVNELIKSNCHSSEVLIPLLKLMSPFAPFVSEELWTKCGMEGSIHLTEYPVFNEKYLQVSTVNYPISVNGKKRGNADFSAEMSKDELEKLALELDFVRKWIDGKEIRKVIVVPGRMINIVV